MSDEANPSAEDMVFNMVHGSNWIFSKFSFKCHVGWHIDPFGHSAFMALNLSRLNYDTFVFSRLDYQDHDRRVATSNMQHNWQPFAKPDANIFTHVMIQNYCFPFGFDFDDNTSLSMV